jgi:hypothetical protein
MKLSFKKYLGSVGCFVIWFISVFVILNNRNDAGIITLVIVENIAMVIALFGIKTFGGIKSKEIDSKNKGEADE